MFKVFIFIIFGISIQAVGQSITIKDINLKEDYHFNKINKSTFRFIYKLSKKDPSQSIFRKIDFDTLLNTKDTTLISFTGEYQMISSANSSRYTATLFGSVPTKSIILHIIDNVSERQEGFPLKTLTPWNRKMPCHLYKSTNPNQFYFTNQIDEYTWELRLINSDGTQVWNRIFRNQKLKLEIMEFLTYANKSILIMQEDPKKRKYSKLIILDSKNGIELNTISLSSKSEKITIDNLFTSDSTLYLTGRQFPDSKINESEIGIPYVKYISPTENTLSEFKIKSPFSDKILWMDEIQTNNGDRFLVGESFKSESQDSYIAKAFASGLLTLGTVSITWCELKFLNIALAKLEDGVLSDPKLIEVAPRKVVVGAFMHSYPFARYALQKGQVRYFGQSNNGNIYVLNENDLTIINVDSENKITIGKITPSELTPIFVFVSDNYGVYFTEEIGANVLRFNLVNYEN